MKAETKEITWKDIPLTITFCYYPASRGSRDSYGVPIEPDEEAFLEVEKVVIGGFDITELLAQAEITEIEEYLLEEHEVENNDDY